MGTNNKLYDRTIPVFKKQELAKELDFLIFSKEKSQKPKQK
jgi:hypothetical protein